MRDFVDKKIRSKHKEAEEAICTAIYYVMNNLQGHSLKDVLALSMPQFYFCLESISQDNENQMIAYKKQQKKNKRKR